MKVIILQGLPGSGKSSFADTQDALVCSADSYHMTDKGYEFRPENQTLAHKECFKKFANAIYAKSPYIIVDNTNTTIYEVLPYIVLARAFDYDVTLRRFNCSKVTSHSRNIHDVPFDVITKMDINLCQFKLPPYLRVDIENVP